MDNITISCFGDSLTYGYCAEYGKDYVSLFRAKVKEDFADKQITIRNRGVNGESSRDGLKRLKDELVSYKPDLVTMMFGSNDSAYSMYYHVGHDEFSCNYDKLITGILETGAKLVLMTPTPVIEDPDLPFILNDTLTAYCEIIREKAKQYDLPLVDLNAIFYAAHEGNLKPLLQWDGEHISTEGYKLFFDSVYKAVKPIIENLTK